MKYLWTKENATGVVRTVVTFLYAWIATNLPGVSDLLDDIGLDDASFTLLAGGLLYQAIRMAAEKWGWVGYALIINQKPEYNDVD